MPEPAGQAGLSRRDRIARARRRLLEETSPRLHMALIVVMTGLIGWLGSFVLLRLGIESMAIRYPMASFVAYLGFLGLIWAWLRTNAEDYIDPVADQMTSFGSAEPSNPGLAAHGGGSTQEFDGEFSGGGGEFSGAGASGNWDAASMTEAAEFDAEAGESLGETLGSVGDADEMTIPLVVIFVLLGLAFASLYVIYAAPLLLAEVLVDGAIAYAFFRHIRGLDPHHWLGSAIRRSIAPFLLTALFLAAMGMLMTHYAPEARSVGDVMRHASVK